MPNWCENEFLIRGSAEEIKKYKNSLLKDATGRYYPWISTVPIPELKDEAEVDAYIEKEHDNKTLCKFHYRVIDLRVIENNPEELELHFATAYGHAQHICTDEIFPKLSIFHKYFEQIWAYHGFSHYVKGKLIASGYEECEDSKSWQMYDYSPWPAGPNPLEDILRSCIVTTNDQLLRIEEVIESLKKEKQ